MPLETGSTIEDLDQSWPLSGDPTNRGDDHLRLIKSILKAQFPGSSGNGYAKTIDATEDELNSLVGVTGNIQDSLTSIEDDLALSKLSLYAPAGTKMPFFQSSAPTGWTQLTTYNDYMMRVVNTAGGGTGGSDSPINKSFTHTHTTGDHSLTAAQNGPHTHSNGYNGVQTGSGGGGPATIGNEQSTGSSGAGAPHNHGSTGQYTSNFTPKYLNVIIANKDTP